MIWRTRPVGLALVGCGNMGRTHAHIIMRAKRCRLHWLHDADVARAGRLCAELGIGEAADSFDRILADPRVEGVLLVTPHYLHFEQAMLALEAGKHVLVEKPMALSSDEARILCERARAARRRLLVGQNMRFWPNVERARAAVEAGEIGEIHHVARRRLVFQKDAGRPWAHEPSQAGGWLIYGITVHEIDAVRYLTGQEVAEVLAVAARVNQVWKDVDELSSLVKFEGGAIGSLVHSLNSHVASLETVIIGDRGSVFLSDMHRGCAVNGVRIPVGDDDGLGEQLHAFLRAIRDGAETRVDAERILPTMVVLDALRDCARKDRGAVREPAWRMVGAGESL